MSTTATQTLSEPVELSRLDPVHRIESHGKHDTVQQPIAVRPDDAAPPNAHSQIERWNHPKSNMSRIIFCFLSFIIAGMNDAAVGV